jgi:uncharacterized membrane protein
LTKSRAILLYSALAVQLVALILSLVVSNSIEDKIDWAIFIGRFHPMVLHFPIGILFGMFFLRVCQTIVNNQNLQKANHLIWILATPSTVIAAILGLFLATSGDYNQHLLNDHKRLGVALAILLLTSSFFRVTYIQTQQNKAQLASRITFALCIVILPIVGHDGGSLTHGSKYLFEYMPSILSFGNKDNNKPIPSDDLNHKVIAIFKEHCYKCHGPEKQKGDYRIDSREHALSDGSSGETAITPHNALTSYLFDLISRTKSDDEIMPPEGKGELNDSQILIIKHWIDDGAKWPTNKKEIAENTNISETINANTSSDNQVTFSKHIWPIIENHCLRCHRAPYVDKKGRNKKPAAGLRLDTANLIMKGSKDAKVIIPGKPLESSFYTLTTLDEDDDDIMPSKGDLLTIEQQKLIHDWILSGASFGNWTKAP